MLLTRRMVISNASFNWIQAPNIGTLKKNILSLIDKYSNPPYALVKQHEDVGQQR
jgi:hypothetical protein